MEEIMKIAKEFREVKKMKIDEGDSLKQILYIKYKNEENTEWNESPGKSSRDNHNVGENRYDGRSRGRTYL